MSALSSWVLPLATGLLVTVFTVLLAMQWRDASQGAPALVDHRLRDVLGRRACSRLRCSSPADGTR